MKIKTAVEYDPDKFDQFVNNRLEEGYILEHRGLLPPDSNGATAHYAQLVLHDHQAAPEEIDLAQCLRHVKEFCANVPSEDCRAGLCPLRAWCDESTGGLDPADWILPEVEG